MAHMSERMNGTLPTQLSQHITSAGGKAGTGTRATQRLAGRRTVRAPPSYHPEPPLLRPPAAAATSLLGTRHDWRSR
jgi:hypothetical protein